MKLRSTLPYKYCNVKLLEREPAMYNVNLIRSVRSCLKVTIAIFCSRRLPTPTYVISLNNLIQELFFYLFIQGADIFFHNTARYIIGI